jgi:magnesium transporter
MTEDHFAVQPEIKNLIHQRNWRALTRALQDWPDPEIADLLLNMETADRVLLYRALPRKRAADIFAHLEHDHQDTFLQELSAEDTRHLLANLSPDDRTALLEELPAEVTQRLMKLLSPEDLAEARQLLGYPEESAGRLMTPDYIAVRSEMTIAEALDHIRRTGRDSETFNLIYVTDEAGKLLDSLRLRRFILASPNAKVESIMDHKYVALSAFDDREKAVQMTQRYDLYALPVVDSEGVLLGIVTVDDVLDVAEAEATEDFHKWGAVAPLESPYSQTPAAFLYRKRVGWLTILIAVNLVSAQILDRYQAYLQEFIVLIFFAPLLIASGGNTGAQSATLMVRGLATGDLDLGRWRKAFVKELLVGLLLGLTTGFLTFLLGAYRGGIDIAMVVGLSMLGIVMVANLIGVILPFTLTRLKLDPAVASSPLITSLMDAIGLLIYFGIVTSFLELSI